MNQLRRCKVQKPMIHQFLILLTSLYNGRIRSVLLEQVASFALPGTYRESMVAFGFNLLQPSLQTVSQLGSIIAKRSGKQIIIWKDRPELNGGHVLQWGTNLPIAGGEFQSHFHEILILTTQKCGPSMFFWPQSSMLLVSMMIITRLDRFWKRWLQAQIPLVLSRQKTVGSDTN